MNHSQRLNVKPAHCWISVDLNGIILCAHCDCMAGLGEVCSHVGATLFLLEDWNRKCEELEGTAVIFRMMSWLFLSRRRCWSIGFSTGHINFDCKCVFLVCVQ